MSYIPHTDAERQQMLAAIGVSTIEDLFDAVPASHRFPKLDLPEPMAEMDVLVEMQTLAEANSHAGDYALFRGAGAYHHYIPAVVNHILMRGEYYTAYTPYQPEMSQGTLQAIFEYQSMIAQLTGMDAANASHYDGATSLAEAVTVALEVSRRKRTKIVLSPALHPMYRAVTRTYHQGNNVQFVGDEQPRTAAQLVDLIDEATAMVAVGYPNFFGQIEPLQPVIERAHQVGALAVVVANPMMLALYKAPGELGADIVVGEGQPLGIPLSFGGPYLGYFTTRKQYVHKMAGRLVGETVDQRGQRAYVLTLTAREQHIKRERATSNICTNQGLMALAAAVYLSLLGKQGLRQVAELCYHKAHYAADQISELPGYSVQQRLPFFKEFVVKCPKPVKDINAFLFEEYNIIGGYDLSQDYPDRENEMLIAVTETNTRAEIDDLVEALDRANN